MLCQKYSLPGLPVTALTELYSPATHERVAVEAGAGEVSEYRTRLLEFQIGT